MKNKRVLMRGDEEQRPYKRLVTRPSLDGISLGSSSKSRKKCTLSAQVLSRLHTSVVALASYNGDTKLRECTGICIESSRPDVTSFLTSIDLIPHTWHRKKITGGLSAPVIIHSVSLCSFEIKVRLPDGQIVKGRIENSDIYTDFFVVSISKVSGFDAAAHLSLDRDMQFKRYRKVAAVWRYFSSGSLKCGSGVDISSPSAHIDAPMLSTCRIPKVGIGGPLVDFDGNFVGMNCSHTKQRKTPYIQRPSILQFLEFHGMIRVDDTTRAIKYEMEEPSFYMTVTGGQRIINGLEETFSKDIFSKPFKGFDLELNQSATSLPSEKKGRLASKMNRSVVSLASFSGFAKKFACTGVFIKCTARSATILTSASLVRVSGEANKIDDNLRIEVCLPNSFRVVGRLNRYNLHYNIALVDIMGYWGPSEIEISGHQVTSCLKVLAVGCLFAHRKLMATEGELLIGKKSDLDCVELCVSTCKITKAGIGGPLIDTDGEFVGMNFYHEEETPFLPRDVIHRLLLNLNKQRTGADVEGDGNRWLLPGRKHRTTSIAEGRGNKWPLPEPRRVIHRDLDMDFPLPPDVLF
ncbi:unnamed protein product [Alopecurus aequalis]